MPALKLCIDCGTLTRNTRCPNCERDRQRARPGPTTIDRNQPGERRRRAAAVANWRMRHGDICPGWQRPAHAATDLTADHIIPVARGGTDLIVLCRSCNGAKGDRGVAQ